MSGGKLALSLCWLQKLKDFHIIDAMFAPRALSTHAALVLTGLILASCGGIRTYERSEDVPTSGDTAQLPACSPDLPYGIAQITCRSPVVFEKYDPYKPVPPLTPLEKAGIKFAQCLNREDALKKARKPITSPCVDPRPQP